MRMSHWPRLLSACSLLSVLPAQAPPLWLPAVFGDHMVLQQATRAPIWGRATPGQRVEAVGSWADAMVATDAAEDGRFELLLPTPKAGGPYTLTLRCGAAERRIQDVLVGEVWLGSGQSNMEMPLGPFGTWRGGVRDFEHEIQTADHPQLRLFQVVRHVAALPVEDVQGSWKVCTPESAGPFSATAYFFARDLQQRLQQPVGVINSSWGGTVAQAWTSQTGLSQFPEFAAEIVELQARRAETPEQRELRRQQWWTGLDRTAIVGDDSHWATAAVPYAWKDSELRDFDGVVWYRRSVALPPEFVGKELTLELGPIDDMDLTFVDGVQVGGIDDLGRWTTPRRYTVPAKLAHAGELQLAVAVVDTGGEGGICGAAEQLRLSCGDRSVPLAGEWRWQRGKALAALPDFPRTVGEDPNRATVLWNGMMAPLRPFALRGFLWYQGESNRYDPAQYERLFPAMIGDWRRQWGQPEADFYFVQIAPYAYGDENGQTAALRQAQAAALRLPHTGMVVTLDVGDARDIHPKDKQAVGHRLMLQALARTYGQKVACEGPTAVAASAENGVVRVRFDHATGLHGDKALQLFELGDADGRWVAAKARIDGASVILAAAGADKVTAVRYGWSAAPDGDLRNGEGLPAAPFELRVGG